MAAQGLASRFPIEELSVMGVAEILPRLPNLLRRIRETADAVVAARPDALIGIDSPDFCLRVARRARAALPGLRVMHYVAPSVWAWRPGRAAKMAEVVDHVLALLPFEPPYMEAAGMTCDFVGHPAAAVPQAERGGDRRDPRRVRRRARPAARGCCCRGRGAARSSRLGPVFAETLRRLRAADPGLAALVPTVDPVAELVAALLPPDAGGWPKPVAPGGRPPAEAEARKRAVFAAADVGARGLGHRQPRARRAGDADGDRLPGAPADGALACGDCCGSTRSTLVNLVTETRAVPEFFQQDCTPETLAPAILRLLDDPAAAAAQRAVGAQAMEILGRGGEPPGLRAARSVLGRLG